MKGLRFDLRSGALGAAIKVGEFNQLGRRLTLRIDRSEDRGTRLMGIFVQVDDRSGTSVAATAEAGRFLATDDPDTILFRLHNGKLIQESPKFSAPRMLAFDSYDLPIKLPRGRSLPRARRRQSRADPGRGRAPRLWRRRHPRRPASRRRPICISGWSKW